MKTYNVLQTCQHFLTFFVCLKYFSASLRFLSSRALLAWAPKESQGEKIAPTESPRDQAGKENQVRNQMQNQVHHQVQHQVQNNSTSLLFSWEHLILQI